MAKRPPRKGEGRPSKYTKELASRICQELALGYSMRTVCKNDWAPAMATIFSWLRDIKEFSEQYEKAKQEATDAMAEDILDIADDGTNDYVEKEVNGKTVEVVNSEHIQRSRLRVDTRKWLMSKMKPKRYGDKMDVTSDGKEISVQGVIVQVKK